MSRPTLPAGVPADNQTQGQTKGQAKGKGQAPAFVPPEMATPRFAASDAPPDAVAPSPRRQYAVPSEYEDDVEDGGRRRPPMPPAARPLMIMVAIVALVGALGAIIFAMSREKLPLCSDLPEWNQYNCRVG